MKTPPAPNTDPQATSVTPTDWNYWLTVNQREQGGKTAKMAQELAPQNEAEQKMLNTLRYYVEQGTPAMNDVRDFAKLARGLFPPGGYVVGTGGTHVWLCRRADQAPGAWPERLAIIYQTGTGNWVNYDAPRPPAEEARPLQVWALNRGEEPRHIDTQSDENVAWAAELDLDYPRSDSASQAVAWMIGTHHEEVEIEEWTQGRFALYRAKDRAERDHEEQVPNETAEAFAREHGGDYGPDSCRLCGFFVAVIN